MRRYASFFHWPDRARAELGIVENLATSLAARNERTFSNLECYKPDPPDCIGRNEAGELIAVEVSEVVCVESVRLNQKGTDVYRDWKPGELREHIEHQLDAKDCKQYHGGPYAEIVVCLFTDEMLLTIDFVQRELAHAVFGPFNQITCAYLLISYAPSIASYPVHTLRIRSRFDLE